MIGTHRLVAPFTSTYKTTLQMLKIEPTLVDNKIGVLFENEVREIVGLAGPRLQSVTEDEIAALSGVFATWWKLYQWYLPMATLQALDGYHYGQWYAFHAANGTTQGSDHKNLNAAVKVVRSALQRTNGFFKGFASFLEDLMTPRAIPGQPTHFLLPLSGLLWDFDTNQELDELYDRVDALQSSAYLSTLTAIFGSGEADVPMSLTPKSDPDFVAMLWAHSPVKYFDDPNYKVRFQKVTTSSAYVMTDYGKEPLPAFLTSFLVSPCSTAGVASAAVTAAEWLLCADNGNVTNLVRMKTDHSGLEDSSSWTSDSTFGDELARQFIGQQTNELGASVKLDWDLHAPVVEETISQNTRLLVRQLTRGKGRGQQTRDTKKPRSRNRRPKRGGKKPAKRKQDSRKTEEREAQPEEFGKGKD
jgi:hypothetical protein